MLNLIIGIAALTLFLATVAYVLTLLANNSRMLALYQRTADLEADVLKARLQEIRNRQRLEAEKIRLAWNGFRKFRITDKVRETEDICSFYLSPHDGKPLPIFSPGKYLTFRFKIPGHSEPLTRCYSLSDSPYHPDRYRVTIKRIDPPRDNPEAPPCLGSNFFHNSLKVRDIIDVKAPNGKFYLDMQKNTPVVFLAGGVGITPLLSMLNAIAEMGTKRETWFFLGIRDRSEHMMKEHLESVAKENEHIQLHVCYSKPGPSAVKNADYQHGERISVDLLKRTLPSSNYDFFVCGPPPMTKQLRKDLAEWGVPKDNIHFEAFGSATVKKMKTEDKPEAASSISVTFTKSGKTIPWNPKLNTLLDFAEDNGIAMDSGCRSGKCGTCLTAIKTGEVTYITDPGLDPEEGSCFTCISIPKDNLTLDA